MHMSRRRPKRSREEMKQATRAVLIEAGMEEFARHGLDASLDAICERAELTRGAFYVHFADREAFILAVMTHVLGGFVATLTEVAGGTTAQSIGRFFAAAVARAPEVHGGRGLRFHHLMDACRRSKQIGDTYRMLVTGGRTQLAAQLAGDQAAKRVRADIPAPALADMMTALALGVVAMLELDVPVDLAKLGETSIALLGS